MSQQRFSNAISSRSLEKPAIFSVDHSAHSSGHSRIESALKLLKKKKLPPIAPDALIPNSPCRKMFVKQKIETPEVEMFRLRLDILNNLKPKDRQNLDELDDDDYEWKELDDVRSTVSKRNFNKGKSSNTNRVNRLDVVQRLQSEPWWKPSEQDKENLQSMLHYLCQLLQLKQTDSYASICAYLVEIFRTHGLDDVLLGRILDIFHGHLNEQKREALDQHAIQTIPQFMFERKDLIIKLLDYAQCCEQDTVIREQVLNSIKYLTDINRTKDLALIMENMFVVRECPAENFSLKMILQKIKIDQGVDHDIDDETDQESVHPVLKKITEEKWFPRDHSPVTLNSILDAIINKLADASKSLLKTLLAHLIELDQIFIYDDEQFDRISTGLLKLFSHAEPDYRMAAATHLALFQRETKKIDLALLHSFSNDNRILVRTECGETLKKLTGIMSEVTLKDCVDEIEHLQKLPEENFSLQNYLNSKQQEEIDQTVVPTLEISHSESNEIDPEVTFMITEPMEDQIIIEDPMTATISPVEIVSNAVDTPPIIELRPTVTEDMNKFIEIKPIEQPTTTVAPTPKESKLPPIVKPVVKQQKPAISPVKSTRTTPTSVKRSFLPNNKSMWDSYEKQTEIETITRVTQINSEPMTEMNFDETEIVSDPMESLVEDQRESVGFYRTQANRRILVPHKVSMNQFSVDQLHVLLDQPSLAMREDMQLTDYQQNQHNLSEIESNRLVSSLIIRGIQIHRQYERLVHGSLSKHLTTPLNISSMSLQHPSSKLNGSVVLPTIGPTESTVTKPSQIHDDSKMKDGIETRNGQKMEAIFDRLFDVPTTNRTRPVEFTHGRLLRHVLKSRGIPDGDHMIRKLVDSDPKFVPILQTKIPQHLIPTIWNDPLVKNIASNFGPEKVEFDPAPSPEKSNEIKISRHAAYNDDSLESFHETIPIIRDRRTRTILPQIATTKINPPRHRIAFGFRELLTDSLNNCTDERGSRVKRRRVYMHILTTSNQNTQRNETNKTISSTIFFPIVARAPVCR